MYFSNRGSLRINLHQKRAGVSSNDVEPDSPVYRESSWSLPPLPSPAGSTTPVTPGSTPAGIGAVAKVQDSNSMYNMQALPGSPMQLQQLQQQQQQLQQLRMLQQQSSMAATAPAVLPQGNVVASPAVASPGPAAVTSLPPPHVLLVAKDPSLVTTFQQVLAQAPLRCMFHIATGRELVAKLEQLKAATGSASGADVLFVQSDVLLEDVALAGRIRRAYGCPMVLLQGSEQSAATLQVDDFVLGPSTLHPLRKEELALKILTWRQRKRQLSMASSTESSSSSAGPAAGAAAASVPAMNGLSPTVSGAMSSPAGSLQRQPMAGSPMAAGGVPLATLASMQRANLQLVAVTAAAAGSSMTSSPVTTPRSVTITEIQPVAPVLGSAAGLQQQARLASPTVVVPVQPSPARGVSPPRATSPLRNAGGLGSVGAVGELMAQVAALRKKVEASQVAGQPGAAGVAQRAVSPGRAPPPTLPSAGSAGVSPAAMATVSRLQSSPTMARSGAQAPVPGQAQMPAPGQMVMVGTHQGMPAMLQQQQQQQTMAAMQQQLLLLQQQINLASTAQQQAAAAAPVSSQPQPMDIEDVVAGRTPGSPVGVPDSPRSDAMRASIDSTSSRSNSFVAAGGSRFRPRPRSLSPLSGGGAERPADALPSPGARSPGGAAGATNATSSSSHFSPSLRIDTDAASASEDEYPRGAPGNYTSAGDSEAEAEPLRTAPSGDAAIAAALSMSGYQSPSRSPNHTHHEEADNQAGAAAAAAAAAVDFEAGADGYQQSDEQQEHELDAGVGQGPAHEEQHQQQEQEYEQEHAWEEEHAEGEHAPVGGGLALALGLLEAAQGQEDGNVLEASFALEVDEAPAPRASGTGARRPSGSGAVSRASGSGAAARVSGSGAGVRPASVDLQPAAAAPRPAPAIEYELEPAVAYEAELEPAPYSANEVQQQEQQEPARSSGVSLASHRLGASMAQVEEDLVEGLHQEQEHEDALFVEEAGDVGAAAAVAPIAQDATAAWAARLPSFRSAGVQVDLDAEALAEAEAADLQEAQREASKPRMADAGVGVHQADLDAEAAASACPPQSAPSRQRSRRSGGSEAAHNDRYAAPASSVGDGEGDGSEDLPWWPASEHAEGVRGGSVYAVDEAAVEVRSPIPSASRRTTADGRSTVADEAAPQPAPSPPRSRRTTAETGSAAPASASEQQGQQQQQYATEPTASPARSRRPTASDGLQPPGPSAPVSRRPTTDGAGLVPEAAPVATPPRSRRPTTDGLPPASAEVTPSPPRSRRPTTDGEGSAQAAPAGTPPCSRRPTGDGAAATAVQAPPAAAAPSRRPTTDGAAAPPPAPASAASRRPTTDGASPTDPGLPPRPSRRPTTDGLPPPAPATTTPSKSRRPTTDQGLTLPEAATTATPPRSRRPTTDQGVSPAELATALQAPAAAASPLPSRRPTTDGLPPVQHEQQPVSVSPPRSRRTTTDSGVPSAAEGGYAAPTFARSPLTDNLPADTVPSGGPSRRATGSGVAPQDFTLSPTPPRSRRPTTDGLPPADEGTPSMSPPRSRRPTTDGDMAAMEMRDYVPAPSQPQSRRPTGSGLPPAGGYVPAPSQPQSRRPTGSGLPPAEEYVPTPSQPQSRRPTGSGLPPAGEYLPAPSQPQSRRPTGSGLPPAEEYVPAPSQPQSRRPTSSGLPPAGEYVPAPSQSRRPTGSGLPPAAEYVLAPSQPQSRRATGSGLPPAEAYVPTDAAAGLASPPRSRRPTADGALTAAPMEYAPAQSPPRSRRPTGDGFAEDRALSASPPRSRRPTGDGAAAAAVPPPGIVPLPLSPARSTRTTADGQAAAAAPVANQPVEEFFVDVPPPEPQTTPRTARRAMRILLASHPIVVTREDFLN